MVSIRTDQQIINNFLVEAGGNSAVTVFLGNYFSLRLLVCFFRLLSSSLLCFFFFLFSLETFESLDFSRFGALCFLSLSSFFECFLLRRSLSSSLLLGDLSVREFVALRVLFFSRILLEFMWCTRVLVRKLLLVFIRVHFFQPEGPDTDARAAPKRASLMSSSTAFLETKNPRLCMKFKIMACLTKWHRCNKNAELYSLIEYYNGLILN